jgi:AcrR family transcriptional regulator
MSRTAEAVKATVRYGQKKFTMKLDIKPRLDRDARREAILDVAGEVFMEQGFAAASMSEIAARLGGSKGTLYNYFRSKDELFAAYVQRHCFVQSTAMFDLVADDGNIEQTLVTLGRAYLDFVLSDFAQTNYRVIIAEAPRNPEIGRIFYESGPMNGARRLADVLAQATARGELRADDPLLAAHQFIGLCQNRMLKARHCNYMPEPTAEEIAKEVDAAVRTFLAAFGTKA